MLRSCSKCSSIADLSIYTDGYFSNYFTIIYISWCNSYMILINTAQTFTILTVILIIQSNLIIMYNGYIYDININDSLTTQLILFPCCKYITYTSTRFLTLYVCTYNGYTVPIQVQVLRQVILIIRRPHGHVTHADTSISISKSSFLGVISR